MATTDYFFELAIAYDNTTTTLDLSQYVATLTPSLQRRKVRSVEAIDGTEYVAPAPRKHGLKVEFRPMPAAALQNLYAFLMNTPWQVWYRVRYRDPAAGGDIVTVANMRIVNEWETRYLLKSIDSNRYYGGFSMELREQ